MMPFGFLLTGWVAEYWSLTKIVQLNLLALTCVAAGVEAHSLSTRRTATPARSRRRRRSSNRATH